MTKTAKFIIITLLLTVFVNQAKCAENSNISTPPTKDAKPFLKSLLIPGWGQYSENRNHQALIFLGIELAMWGGMYGFSTYGDWLENDYKAYAELHADIEAQGKNHLFFVDIGNYDNRQEYNERQQLERDYTALYMSPEFDWDWDTDANRKEYENIRIKSDAYKNSVIYFAGAIVVNHIISAVDAGGHSKPGVNYSTGIKINPDGKLMLTLTRVF